MDKNDKYLSLAWQDLEKWAGAAVVKRGKSYIRRVAELCLTKEGNLLAWVQGTERYVTLVRYSGKKKLESSCTCPYPEGPCKHAVAIILAYLEKRKIKEAVPIVDDDDERLPLLARIMNTSIANAEIKDWSIDEENTEKSIRDYLNGMQKEKLLQWILDHIYECPSLKTSVLNTIRLKKGDVEEIVKITRREIGKLTSITPWWNHWKHEGEIPDYDPVEKRLEYLLKSGCADAVISLGEDLVQYGLKQISESDDEGETAYQISSCMKVVCKAIPKSSLSPVEQLLWVIDALMKDEWDVFDDAEKILEESRYSIEDWTRVSDALLERLEKAGMPDDNKKDEHDYYEKNRSREHIRKWVIHALDAAQRGAEAVSLLEREAPVTQCYEPLVEHLIKAREYEKAEEWAIRGFRETIDNYRGIAQSMMKHLETLAERKKDYSRCVAMRALRFFHSPGSGEFTEIEKMAEKAGAWPQTRTYLLYYLETGDNPYKSQSEKASSCSPTTKQKRPKVSQSQRPPWLLPDPGIRFPGRYKESHFPLYDVLIDIAILEKRKEDVIKWYEESIKGGREQGAQAQDVAEFVKDTHPDMALRIWKQRVNYLLGCSNVSNYHEAKRYLEKIHSVYKRENRLEEWRSLMAELRESNKHRRRMIEVLDSLEGKSRKPKRQKIIDL